MVIVPLQERMVGTMRARFTCCLARSAAVSHRVRERREPAARPRDVQHARDGAARGARRRPLAHHPAARRREPAARPRSVARWGSMLAYLGTGLLVRVAPADLPRLDEVHVDLTVLALRGDRGRRGQPALRPRPRVACLSRDLRDPLDRRRIEGHGCAADRTRLRTALAVAEIGLAVVLAIGGGVLFRSFMALSTVSSAIARPTCSSFRRTCRHRGRERSGEGRRVVTTADAGIATVPGVRLGRRRRRTADGRLRLERLIRRRGQAHVRARAEPAVRATSAWRARATSRPSARRCGRP